MNSDSNNLIVFGWNSHFENLFAEHDRTKFHPGRVVLEHKGIYQLQTGFGEIPATVSGKLRYDSSDREDLPAVGDWVVAQIRPAENAATIHAVLPRQSKFARRAPYREYQQIVGANIDVLFLVTSLNNDFNLRRLERYLLVTWESGARPVILLSKSDLCDDVENKLAEVESIAVGVPIHAVSVVDNVGLDELDQYLRPGQTVALMGSSGVGKSTLINWLVGHELQRVQEIRGSDDRGKHTTTNRQLVLLPQGGLVLDTPGMRELQLWNSGDGVGKTFEDIESLAEQCRFSDCKHGGEPGCAVMAALQDGALDEGRYQNYEKLRKELRHAELRQDRNAQRVEKDKWKKLTRLAKDRSKHKRE